MRNRITEEEFLQEFYKQANEEYELLGKYTKYLEKIKIKHLICGFEYYVTPRDFIKRNCRCSKCKGNLKLSHEDFLEKVFNKYGNEYEVIGEYKNRDTKLIFKHLKCKHEWETRPHVFLNSKHGCPKCSGNIKKKTTAFFKSEIFELVGDEYTVLGEYIPNYRKIEIRHNKCGHIWNADPHSLLQGSRCPKCNGGVRKTLEQFKDEVFKLVGNEYQVIGDYVNNITRIQMHHILCDKVSEICPIDFLEGGRCLYCNLSKGERNIQNYLFKNNITYINQFTYEDCVHKRQLPFDFAVVNADKVVLLIEYDGEQHFKPNEFFGGNESFELTQLRDGIKNTYCKENNIPLLRIPYWDFNNIEEILHNELIRYNLILNNT